MLFMKEAGESKTHVLSASPAPYRKAWPAGVTQGKDPLLRAAGVCVSVYLFVSMHVKVCVRARLASQGRKRRSQADSGLVGNCDL